MGTTEHDSAWQSERASGGGAGELILTYIRIVYTPTPNLNKKRTEMERRLWGEEEEREMGELGNRRKRRCVITVQGYKMAHYKGVSYKGNKLPLEFSSLKQQSFVVVAILWRRRRTPSQGLMACRKACE